MEVYKINIKSQYKTLSFVLLIIMIFLGFIIYKQVTSYVSLVNVLPFFLILFTFFVFPSIYLFIEYLIISISVIVSIDKRNNKIKVKNRDRVNNYEITDIVKIIKVCSLPVAESRISWNASDSFFYYRIIIKDGSEIIITSLMTDYFKISGVDFEIEKRFFASIFPRKVMKVR